MSLPDQARIIDLLYQGKDEADVLQKEKKKPVEYVLIFRVRLFLGREINALGPIPLNFYYVQAVSDVLRGNYPHSDEESIILAAYLTSVEFGDSALPDALFTALNEFSRKYMYKKSVDKFSNELTKFKNNIEEQRAKLKGLSVDDIKKKALDHIRTFKLYGSTLFNVVEQQQREKKEELILGISENGLTFVHTVSKLALKKPMKINEIENVEGKDGLLTFTVGQFLQQKKFIFESSVAHTLAELLKAYLSFVE